MIEGRQIAVPIQCMGLNWSLPPRIFYVNGKKTRMTIEAMMWGTFSIIPFNVTAKFLLGVRGSCLLKMALFKCDIV